MPLLRFLACCLFAAVAPADGAWFRLIYNFGSMPADGALPVAPVVIGRNGILYGTTQFGGSAPPCVSGYTGCGTVFSLMPPPAPEGTWVETILHNFTGGADGGILEAGLAIGNDGVLYGVASNGGTGPCNYDGRQGCGVVFALTPPASPIAPWTETILYNFTGGRDGSHPNSLVFDKDGTLYGTTQSGGLRECPSFPGCGNVFSLHPPASPGGGWQYDLLHEFRGVPSPGNPAGPLLISGDLLYGTTFGGGTNNCQITGCGTVFSLTPPESSGDSWTEQVLYNFTGLDDGGNPDGGIVRGTDGSLYGTTDGGGSGDCGYAGFAGCGTIFELSPPGSAGAPWIENTLYSFDTHGLCSNGGIAVSGVAIGENGVLYGTTDCGYPYYSGSIYSLTPPVSAGALWTETTLFSFNPRQGTTPYAKVVIGPNGVLYGTTYYGGAEGLGTIFALLP